MVYLDTCILLGIYVLNWKTRGIYLPWTKTGQNPVLVGVRCRSKHHPQFLALPFSCLRDHLGCGACGPMFCSRAALVSPTGFFRVDRRVSNGRRRRYGQEGSTKFRPLGPGRSKKKTTNESDHSGSLLPPWRVRTDMTSMFFFFPLEASLVVLYVHPLRTWMKSSTAEKMKGIEGCPWEERELITLWDAHPPRTPVMTSMTLSYLSSWILTWASTFH